MNIIQVSRFLQLASVAFVRRVRARAHDSGHREVYFLARDATYFHQINEYLNRVEGRDVIGQVLHVNRKLVWLATIEDDLAAVDKTVDYFAQRTTADTLSVAGYLDFWGESAARVDEASPKAISRDQLVTKITQSDSYRETIFSILRANRTNFLSYLQQQNFPLNGPVICVDIGYKSSFAKLVTLAIAKQHGAKTRPDISNFQFMYDARVHLPANVVVEDLHFFRSDCMPAILNANYSWLEVFFKDRSLGDLCRYVSNDGEIEPVRKNVASQPAHFLQVPDDCKVPSLTAAEHQSEDFIETMLTPSESLLQEVAALSFERGVHRPQAARGIVRQLTWVDIANPVSLRALVLDDVWITGSLVNSGFRPWILFVRVVYWSLSCLKRLRGNDR